MLVAISQPEHFPYLGFFEKMRVADVFVVLDSVQFSGPRSFQNRNKFPGQGGADQWFTVPVEKGSYFKLIQEVRVAPDYGWRRKLLRTLHLKFGVDLSHIYDSEFLSEINLNSIQMCRAALGVSTPVLLSSSLGVEGQKCELLEAICKKVGGTEYLCGPGGATYTSSDSFKDIKVRFFEPVVPDYYSTLYHIINK